MNSVSFLSSRLEASAGGYFAMSRLHNDLSKLESGKIAVDFSAVGWADAHLASALRVVVDHAFRRNQSLTFLNVQSGIQTIMRKNGFFDGRLADVHSTTIPCTLFVAGKEVEFAEFARKHLSHASMPRMTPSLKRKFFEGIDEIFANCSLHSDTPVPITTCGQFYPKKEKLSFVISDGGRGMRGSYVKWSGEAISAEKAIDWAMQPENTSRIGDIPGGLGLALIRDFVSLNGGRLAVASEGGFWCQEGPNVSMQSLRMPYPGTSVVLEIDCADKKQYDVYRNADPDDIW